MRTHLRSRILPCYGCSLRILFRKTAYCLSNISKFGCHGLFSPKFLILCGLWMFPQILLPQFSRIIGIPAPPPPSLPSELTPDHLDHVLRPNAPPVDRTYISADSQQSEGSIYHLRGHAVIELTDSVIKADEIDYNEETGYTEARGHVFYQNFVQNEKITCDKVEYNVDDQTGKFYNVHGYAKTHIDARPGLLTSNNPFYFEAKWAERIEDKYILHDGMITGCKLPNPWWSLRGPRFDIIPNQRAKAYKSVFRIRRFPVFYTPFFYKSLEKEPRRSGFLTPNIGHSSLRGYMFGFGYFWAINRSYDMTYKFQDWTETGYAHHVELRGKPNATTDFDAVIYGVQENKLQPGMPNYSGFDATAVARTAFGDGWYGKASLNYLSSLGFRQQFSESFNEAIFSESISSGFVGKNFGSYSFNVDANRVQLFEDSNYDGDYIIIRKLPEVDFTSRDQQIVDGPLPLWFSFDSNAGLLHRRNPDLNNGSTEYQTSQFMPRADVAPQIMTALRWEGITLAPTFGVREAFFGQSFQNGLVSNNGLNQFAVTLGADLILPSVERVFEKKTIFGDKLKHVIEPRVSYRYATGVDNFNNLIRFDETELLADTNALEFSVTQRLYAKRADKVLEIFSWSLGQELFFNPSFGDAIISGQRNVTLDSLELTAYAFLDQPRHYSPIVSAMRTAPFHGLSFEWRADYDPLRHGLIDSSLSVDLRIKHFVLAGGNNDVRGVYLAGTNGQVPTQNESYLSPPANQYRMYAGYGDTQRRGWNAGVSAVYDYLTSTLDFATIQATYNTDCCGFSVQVRRFNFGTRDDTQYRLAFTIANIGSFGTLRKQDRLF